MQGSTGTAKSIRIRDIFILGFAFFATYFGAGNLIFPPLLGLNSGSDFISGLAGLTVSGILLPILALIVVGFRGHVRELTDRVDKYTYNVLQAALVFACTFVAIPRTCATAIQLGIQGNIPAAPFLPLTIVYFVLTYFFTADERNVLDRIGKYLTPLLALILVLIAIAGVWHPLGTPAEPAVPHAFVNAFLGGYNTGDVLVSFIMAVIFLGSVRRKGYDTPQQLRKVIVYCGLVAIALLFIIYGGLLYMGASVSAMYPQDIGRAELLVAVIKGIDPVVMLPMGIAVVLACLTTAVGETAAVAEFIRTISHGRVSYKQVAAISCVLSGFTALLGVDGIVTYVGWIFGVSYPPCLALMVLGVIMPWVPNRGAYRGAVYAVFLYALLEAFPGLSSLAFVKALVGAVPLAAYGFGWIPMFIVGFIIGGILYSVRGKDDLYGATQK